jgi:DNA-binding transcriptional ArsR family regulator
MSPFTALGLPRRLELLRSLTEAPGWTRLGDPSPEMGADRRALRHTGLLDKRPVGKHLEYRATDLGVRLVGLDVDHTVFAALGHETREAAVRMLLDKGPLPTAVVYQSLPVPVTKQSFSPQRDALAAAGLLTSQPCPCGHGRILTATTTAGALIAAVDIELSEVSA